MVSANRPLDREGCTPPFLPEERDGDELLKPDAEDVVIERPARRDMPNQYGALPFPLGRQLVEEGDDACHRLTPTLSPRKRLVESARPLRSPPVPTARY